MLTAAHSFFWWAHGNFLKTPSGGSHDCLGFCLEKGSFYSLQRAWEEALEVAKLILGNRAAAQEIKLFTCFKTFHFRLLKHL